MTPAFRPLLNRFAMPAFERQMVLADMLGDDFDWDLDLKGGTVSFGPGRNWGLQLLGTRSDETDTWRWAWATKGAPVPASALKAAKAVKAMGRKRSVPELLEEEYPPDAVDLDAHMLSMVATGIAELPVYFRFPYSGGALFAGLEIPDFQLPAPDPQRLAFVIREVCDRMDLDQRVAIEGYLGGRGAKLSGDKDRLLAAWPDGAQLEVTFDEERRLRDVRPAASGSGVSAGG